MKQTEEKKIINERLVYTSPCITLIEINTDVITTSSGDPNMGEWDTEI